MVRIGTISATPAVIPGGSADPRTRIDNIIIRVFQSQINMGSQGAKAAMDSWKLQPANDARDSYYNAIRATMLCAGLNQDLVARTNRAIHAALATIIQNPGKPIGQKDDTAGSPQSKFIALNIAYGWYGEVGFLTSQGSMESAITLTKAIQEFLATPEAQSLEQDPTAYVQAITSAWHSLDQVKIVTGYNFPASYQVLDKFKQVLTDYSEEFQYNKPVSTLDPTDPRGTRKLAWDSIREQQARNPQWRAEYKEAMKGIPAIAMNPEASRGTVESWLQRMSNIRSDLSQTKKALDDNPDLPDRDRFAASYLSNVNRFQYLGAGVFPETRGTTTESTGALTLALAPSTVAVLVVGAIAISVVAIAWAIYSIESTKQTEVVTHASLMDLDARVNASKEGRTLQPATIKPQELKPSPSPWTPEKVGGLVALAGGLYIFGTSIMPNLPAPWRKK